MAVPAFFSQGFTLSFKIFANFSDIISPNKFPESTRAFMKVLVLGFITLTYPNGVFLSSLIWAIFSSGASGVFIKNEKCHLLHCYLYLWHLWGIQYSGLRCLHYLSYSWRVLMYRLVRTFVWTGC